MIWLRKMMHRFGKWLISKYPPSIEQICLMWVYHTSKLQLAPTEIQLFAPLLGCCGPFKLTGNSLPVLEYMVFNRAKHFPMEFVKVRVEIARPEKIHFICKVWAENLQDKTNHGQEIDLKPEFRRPFDELSRHLFSYFPIPQRELK